MLIFLFLVAVYTLQPNFKRGRATKNLLNDDSDDDLFEVSFIFHLNCLIFVLFMLIFHFLFVLIFIFYISGIR